MEEDIRKRQLGNLKQIIGEEAVRKAIENNPMIDQEHPEECISDIMETADWTFKQRCNPRRSRRAR